MAFHEQDLNLDWTSSKINPADSPYTQNGQPWDQRFHLILNLAVGGGPGYWPPAEFGPFDTPALYDGAAAAWTRPRMEVEHVKVCGSALRACCVSLCSGGGEGRGRDVALRMH